MAFHACVPIATLYIYHLNVQSLLIELLLITYSKSDQTDIFRLDFALIFSKGPFVLSLVSP